MNEYCRNSGFANEKGDVKRKSATAESLTLKKLFLNLLEQLNVILG